MTAVQQQVSAVRQQAGIADRPGSFFILPWDSPLPPPAAPGEVAGDVAAVAGEAIEPDCTPLTRAEADAYIQEAAREQGFTPDLLRAVIQQESGYLPCAVSSKGAQGLMQLMPGTASDLGVVDPFDPAQNIDGGARYLSDLLVRYDGDLELALAAYNAGPARVDEYRGLPPIPETINYVADIMGRLEGSPVLPGADLERPQEATATSNGW